MRLQIVVLSLAGVVVVLGGNQAVGQTITITQPVVPVLVRERPAKQYNIPLSGTYAMANQLQQFKEVQLSFRRVSNPFNPDGPGQSTMILDKAKVQNVANGVWTATLTNYPPYYYQVKVYLVAKNQMPEGMIVATDPQGTTWLTVDISQ